MKYRGPAEKPLRAYGRESGLKIMKGEQVTDANGRHWLFQEVVSERKPPHATFIKLKSLDGSLFRNAVPSSVPGVEVR